jgi:Ser/Thr protein kinase RdoA (MazF antagonist)
MAAGLDRFERRAAAALPTLRAQVVHNDLSGDNVVADPDDHDLIAGLLDFGDATRTAMINDVAVAVAYQIRNDTDLLAAALALMRGFTAVRPLLGEEVDLLLDLVIARMVIRVGISEWRGRRFPENIAYIRRNTAEAWRALEQLLALDPDRTTALFHQACRPE